MRTIKILAIAFLSVLFFYSCSDWVEKHELPEAGSIKDVTPPSAAFVFTQDKQIWEEFSFDNKSSGALNYEWDFGDGTTISTDILITNRIPKN